MDSCFTTKIRWGGGRWPPLPVLCFMLLCLNLLRVCAQDGVCQVFLHEGHVVVRAGNSEIKSQKTYNDDNSHYVAIYNNING